MQEKVKKKTEIGNIFQSKNLYISKKSSIFAADFGMRTRARSCANNYLL